MFQDSPKGLTTFQDSPKGLTTYEDFHGQKIRDSILPNFGVNGIS
ncbi:hypothetical protein PL9631_400010 [Planktothrix paucivesiculata PCC 9631]|uniref:Uncharacterized protein n=1 Tax=Planktothrix paucivesiculata PCC 9631 TaxID=671071 RepID=A0A7Z9BQS3_9CYAN|nr:hypothetical protein PL9631_400010 [Planktothrix paucivesiculata PCC 9631]